MAWYCCNIENHIEPELMKVDWYSATDIDFYCVGCNHIVAYNVEAQEIEDNYPELFEEHLYYLEA